MYTQQFTKQTGEQVKMKILGMISMGVGIIGGIIIALSGRIPDAIAGATIFIGLGVYFTKKAQNNG